MSRANSPPNNETTHLVSLVLHSKKALQHGEQLCSQAHDLTRTTSNYATDVLALEAKARWVTQGMQEQLKLAATVSRSLEIQTSRLINKAKEWDKARSFHSGNLDSILESLEKQLVPPDFYLSSSSSSLFGSQHSNDVPNGFLNEAQAAINGRQKDRSKWKNLRDFVDFSAIMKAMDEMDEDRDALDDIIGKIDVFPLTLNETITSLKERLPPIESLVIVRDILLSQEATTSTMATHLQSLASHYDEMQAALRDSEAGIEIGDEDMTEMNRDTEELPSVISDLEEDAHSLKAECDQLQDAKDEWIERLSKLSEIMVLLEDLEEMMMEMLNQQADVEVEFSEQLSSIQQHLVSLEHLYNTYTAYEISFNALVIEMERRRRYKGAAEEIVRGMTRQLEAMRQEEIIMREAFSAEHGNNLPDDLCTCVGNIPTQFEVQATNDSEVDELPAIDDELLAEATKKMDLAKDGTESL